MLALSLTLFEIYLSFMPLLQDTILFQAMNTHINNLKLLRSQPDELKQALPEVGRDRGTFLYLWIISILSQSVSLYSNFS